MPSRKPSILLYTLPAAVSVVAMNTFLQHCTPRTAPIARVAVAAGSVLVDEMCTELTSDGDATEWVDVLCPIAQTAGQVVHLVMPRKHWAAMRAYRTVDAGPGK